MKRNVSFKKKPKKSDSLVGKSFNLGIVEKFGPLIFKRYGITNPITKTEIVDIGGECLGLEFYIDGGVSLHVSLPMMILFECETPEKMQESLDKWFALPMED